MKKKVYFRADHNEVAYDQLIELSKLLNTTKIYFTGIVKTWESCPTCGPEHDYYCEVSVSEVGAMK